MKIQLIQGDCLEKLKDIPDGSIDLIIADPPYNVGYKYSGYKDNLSGKEYFEWQIKFLYECERVLKENGSLFYLNYPEFNSKIYVSLEEKFNLKPLEIIAWVYPTNMGGTYLRKAFRTWIWASKGQPINNITGEYANPTDKRIKKLIAQDRKPKSVDWWLFNQVKNVSSDKTEHPCQLPIEMIRKIILGTSNELDLILDPFMGSGTVGIVCKESNRNFIGIEIVKQYFQIAQEQIKNTNMHLNF